MGSKEVSSAVLRFQNTVSISKIILSLAFSLRVTTVTSEKTETNQITPLSTHFENSEI